MKPIITVENLSKQYRIGTREASYETFRDALVGAINAPFKRLKRNGHLNEKMIWALKEVNLEIMPGEVVGIIGRNGAGKSTLLKILSRITEPTEGQADIYGRVASLLEVGTGFHAELSGRENIYLSGAILGMSRREIQRKFDEIVAFAEIDKFIDTPVKHYSSGMYLRLAFAVAAHLEPEILLIDEILAVGDYSFQQKCLQKAGKVARDGRTVLLVSHNLAVLSEIAKSAIWLDGGEVRQVGALHSVVQSYVSSDCADRGEWRLDSRPTGIPAFVDKVRVVQNGQSAGDVMINQSFQIELDYTVGQRMPFCRVGVIVSNSLGSIIFSTAEPDDPSISPVDRGPGRYTTCCTIPEWLLSPDTYFLTLHIDDAPLRRLFTANQACSFTVVENAYRGVAHIARPGVIAPKLPWTMSQL